MANHQQQNDEKSSSKSPIQTQNSKGLQDQSTNKHSKSSRDSESDEGGQLIQLVEFIKDNWKEVLSQMVTAGVTAYLAHNAKEKASAGKHVTGNEHH